MKDFEETEQERTGYIGQDAKGVYYNNEWIPWEKMFPDNKGPVQIVSDEEEQDLTKSSFNLLKGIEPPIEKYSSQNIRLGKVSFGVPVMVTMVPFQMPS